MSVISASSPAGRRHTRAWGCRGCTHALFLACAVLLCLRAPALTIRGGSSQDNARFYEGGDRNFQWESFDWSGVGRSSDGHWGTMVSDSYFVSANHYHPGTSGTTIDFWPGNDDGVSHTYTIAGGTQILGDIWLGWLDSPLDPAHAIATYPLLMLDTLDDYLGQDVLLYGGGHNVGANEIIGFTTSVSTYLEVLYEYDDPGVPYESVVTGGDSGAPTFVPWNGGLALIGTHWYWYDRNGDKVPHGTGDPFLPAYVDEIEAEMVGESLSFVPEPGAFGALVLGLCMLAGRRRR